MSFQSLGMRISLFPAIAEFMGYKERRGKEGVIFGLEISSRHIAVETGPGDEYCRSDLDLSAIELVYECGIKEHR